MSRLIAAIKNLLYPTALNCTGPTADTDQCAKANDPSQVLESLANAQHWSMGADMADAYGGACISPCAVLSDTWGSTWSY